jgi:hypothetical protein
MRTAWTGVCLLLVASGLEAGNGSVARRHLEATMSVAGSLDVDGSGNVTAYVLDHPEKLPAGVTQLLAQTLPAFRFEPVRRDGVPRPVHATMNLVVAANQVDPEHISIRVRSALFLDADVPVSGRVTVNVGTVPRYPEDAARANVGGAVYVAMRIDRSGNVLDAQVQQVNLFAVDSESQMRHWRSVLGKATVRTVRRYTFKVPTTGAHAADASFTGVLPVVYRIGAGVPVYGQWDTYVPGPRETVAWLADDEVFTVAGETIPDGAFAQTGTALKLLTPIGGG